jgi:hypothetical protein
VSSPKTRIIDEMSVTCVPLDGWVGYSLLPEIALLLAPLLSARDGAIDLEVAVRNSAASFGQDKLPDLLTRLLSGTVIVASTSNGSVKYEVTDRATFSLAFSGPRFWSALKVAAFAFEVTYGNFTDVVERIKKAAPTP